MINKTFDELAEQREQDGYIDMDKILGEQEESIREVRGNVNRQKDWIRIKDGSILVKTNAEGQCNAEYSELICCELAKQACIETAKYDMVRYKGETGLITENICNDSEEMISLYELIGTGPDNPEYPDTIDIHHVFDSLDEKLVLEGVDEDEIDKCLLNLRKQLLFDLCVMETDRHLENISFIKSKVNGKVVMSLAPMYDTESALVLYEENPEYMKKIYDSYLNTAKTIAMQEPKISVLPEIQEDESLPADMSPALSQFLMQLRRGVKTVTRQEYSSPSEEMWKKTFDFLCEDERTLEYWKNTLSKMNIREAIKAVETKIGVVLPEHIKKMSTACFEERKDAMNYQIPAVTIEKKVENEKTRTDIIY